MVIKALTLCAALLAPRSTGEDPHGRALHLKLYDSFDSSYEACIHTVKMARSTKVDPFMTTAFVYETSGFGGKKIKNKRFFKKLAKIYGCERLEETPRTSCSATTLAFFHLTDLLRKTDDYYEAICGAFEANSVCYRENEKRTTKTLNLARRFVYVYNRRFKRTVLNWAFEGTESRREHSSRPRSPPSPLSHLQPSENEDIVFFEMGDERKQLKFMSLVLGPGFQVNFEENIQQNNPRMANFYVNADHYQLRNRLINVANHTNERYFRKYQAHKLIFINETDFRLFFRSRSRNFSLKFVKSSNLYQIHVE